MGFESTAAGFLRFLAVRSVLSVTGTAGWFGVGMSVFTMGAVLEFVLIVVALAGIVSSTSYAWATLTVVAMLLLAVGLIITQLSRQRTGV